MFSIIIPVKEINDYVRKNLSIIESFKNNTIEVILLPNFSTREDSRLSKKYIFLKILHTGKISPGKKRDLGALQASHRTLVFLDDDSFPDSSFFIVLQRGFDENPNAIAIGGPGITPSDSTFLEKVSGSIFLSKFSGGNPERYRSIGKKKKVDDWPSVNLSVKKDAFLKAGGFNSNFWPGDDTLLCNNLLRLHPDKDIIYLPDLIVHHYRRGSIKNHLKQIFLYGLHRGYFSKNFPQNSLRLQYFVPSIFLIFTLLFVSNMFLEIKFFTYLFSFVWFTYFGAMFLATIQITKVENLTIALTALPLIFLTHLTYGFAFLRGFCKKNLKSQLR